MPASRPHPIAIVGAGPIGLAAAARCAEAGADFVLLEAGPQPGWAVRHWSHVRLFSPWSECIHADAAALLQRSGWQPPRPDHHPTGAELLRDYLDPLAAHPALRPHIRLGNRVVAIGRDGDGQTDAARFYRPFVLRLDADGTLFARAVIDASGSWFNPQQLPVERRAGRPGRVFDAMPDLSLGRVRARFRGKRVLVIGGGHSGMTAIVGLSACLGPGSCTEIAWISRSARPPGEQDHPPDSARAALEARAFAAAAAANVSLIGDMTVTSLVETAHGVSAIGKDRKGGGMEVRADLAILSIGYRPDLAIADRLRLAVDPRWEAPIGLADLIDPERHSCSSVPGHGAAELAHPEPDFFIAGMKSYGRAPNFALTTGYGQVDSIVDQLVGPARPLPSGRSPPRSACRQACTK